MATELLEAPELTRDPSIDASIDLVHSETVALMAEYDSVDGVMTAAAAVRAAGYTRFDVHSPFPVHGIDPVMGIKMTVLPWIVLCGGLTGLTLGTILQHYTNGVTIPSLSQFSGYEFLISGKPIFSTQAYIPIMFEMTILFSAFCAVFGMLLMNNLPMLYNPLLRSHRFKRVTDDRFFLVIETRDPMYDDIDTVHVLRSTRPLAVERVED